jgi:acyl-CoA synthetase (AMP-forming)/AMP-acid ligase II
MAPKFSKLIDILRYRANVQGEQKAYTYLLDGELREESLTYRELDRQARAVGAWLQLSGGVGERVLLLIPPGVEYIAAFFGCLYAGAIAVPAYPPPSNEKLRRLKLVASDAQAGFGITTSAVLSRFESLSVEERELRTVRWLTMDRLDVSACTEWKEPQVCKDALALIQYTSGSTTEPKGAMVTHGNLIDNSAIIYQRFGHSAESRGVIWLPPYHDMGLIGGLVQPLYGGFAVTLMSPVAFLMRPVRWLQAISRTHATTSGGPNFAYDLCARKISKAQRAGLDLSCWRVAFNGAEPVRSDTIERFAAAFAECGFRRNAFYPCYGLAEATLFVAGGPKASGPVACKLDPKALECHQALALNGDGHGRTLVSCGSPAAEFDVAIVDPDRRTRCVPDRVGEIWLAGKSVALGYWNRPEETERTFAAYLSGTGEGPFLRTGDLGFFLDDRLVIVGRLKEVMILAGRNHYPQDIEQTAEKAHPVLQSASCAAFSVDIDGEEKLIVLAELDRAKMKHVESDEVRRSIRRAVAEHHDVRVQEIFLLPPGTIPKTTSGKIRRQACRTSFLTGSLQELHEVR